MTIAFYFIQNSAIKSTLLHMSNKVDFIALQQEILSAVIAPKLNKI